MDKELIHNAGLIINSLEKLNHRFSGKSILITGAGGFLGTQFVYYFSSLNKSKILSKKCKLYLWDNFIRGVPKWMDNFKNDE